MCLILLALKSHPVYKLIMAGNRDEFFERPTAQATFWEDTPDLLAGKDLRAGGTWFGITKQGRIAAITDYRDLALLKSNTPSRGELVRNFLLSRERPQAFIDGIAQKAHQYNGFNLIVGEKDEFCWYSNLVDEPRRLEPGIYGLCNHLLDTPWPKVVRSRNAFQSILTEKKHPSPEDFFPSFPTDQPPPTRTSRRQVLRSNGRECFHLSLSPVRNTAPDPQLSYWLISMIE